MTKNEALRRYREDIESAANVQDTRIWAEYMKIALEHFLYRVYRTQQGNIPFTYQVVEQETDRVVSTHLGWRAARRALLAHAV